jgi:hypothetical protein
MAVLENYVKLVSGIPKRLHFKDHAFTIRRIRDPASGFIKNVQVLEFLVDWEDGAPVEKIFSVIQSKLAAALQPYLEGKRYRDYLFTITKIGEGFTAEFRVEAIPWTVG